MKTKSPNLMDVSRQRDGKLQIETYWEINRVYSDGDLYFYNDID